MIVTMIGNGLVFSPPLPVDRWFIPLFIGFQSVSTIRLVVQDFATIHSSNIAQIFFHHYQSFIELDDGKILTGKPDQIWW